MSSSTFPCSDETYVIGFVVPNQKQLLALAEQYRIRGSFEELCENLAMEEVALTVITEAALAGQTSPRLRSPELRWDLKMGRTDFNIDMGITTSRFLYRLGSAVDPHTL